MSNLTKVARIATVVGAVGAISLVGIEYGSQSPAIQSAINGLKEKALGWKNQAGLNKAELNKMTEQYNALEAKYNAVLGILKVDGTKDINTIKQQVQEIYDNANNTDSTSIVATNNTLKSIADALGVTLTEEDKVEGVYGTKKIMDELTELDTKLNELEQALGDLAINLNSGDMEYRENMTLTQKINYLIGQINEANKDQAQLKINAENANNDVGAVDPNYTVNNADVSGKPGKEPEIIPGESTPEQPTKPTKPVDPPVDDNNSNTNNNDNSNTEATITREQMKQSLIDDGLTTNQAENILSDLESDYFNARMTKSSDAYKVNSKFVAYKDGDVWKFASDTSIVGSTVSESVLDKLMAYHNAKF